MTGPLLITETRWAPISKEHTSWSCRQPLTLTVFTVFIFSRYQGNPKNTVNSCKYSVVNYQHKRRHAHTQDVPKITDVLSWVFPTKMQIIQGIPCLAAFKKQMCHISISVGTIYPYQMSSTRNNTHPSSKLFSKLKKPPLKRRCSLHTRIPTPLKPLVIQKPQTNTVIGSKEKYAYENILQNVMRFMS